MSDKLDDSGHFNQQWLNEQTTERLRYEAKCENIRNWSRIARHTLITVLRQIRIF